MPVSILLITEAYCDVKDVEEGLTFLLQASNKPSIVFCNRQFFCDDFKPANP